MKLKEIRFIISDECKTKLNVALSVSLTLTYFKTLFTFDSEKGSIKDIFRAIRTFYLKRFLT